MPEAPVSDAAAQQIQTNIERLPLLYDTLVSQNGKAAAIYVPMAPIASAFFGWLLLDEPLGGLFLVGLACAVAAPLLIALERRRRTE